jgi:hypothetical protein
VNGVNTPQLAGPFRAAGQWPVDVAFWLLATGHSRGHSRALLTVERMLSFSGVNCLLRQNAMFIETKCCHSRAFANNDVAATSSQSGWAQLICKLVGEWLSRHCTINKNLKYHFCLTPSTSVLCCLEYISTAHCCLRTILTKLGDQFIMRAFLLFCTNVHCDPP